jgi:hypothetical protein
MLRRTFARPVTKQSIHVGAVYSVTHVAIFIIVHLQRDSRRSRFSIYGSTLVYQGGYAK